MIAESADPELGWIDLEDGIQVQFAPQNAHTDGVERAKPGKSPNGSFWCYRRTYQPTDAFLHLFSCLIRERNAENL